MKYFKKELWASLNSDDDDVSAWAEAEYERKFVEYAEHLKEITPRLAGNASRFFNKVNLHDGVLLSFSVGDALDIEEKGQIINLQTRIKVKVRLAENGAIYTLNYSGISRCTVDFPGAFPLFYEPGSHLVAGATMNLPTRITVFSNMKFSFHLVRLSASCSRGFLTKESCHRKERRITRACTCPHKPASREAPHRYTQRSEGHGRTTKATFLVDDEFRFYVS